MTPPPIYRYDAGRGWKSLTGVRYDWLGSDVLNDVSSHRREAFTLIEVLVVVAIIALLVAILLPSLRQAREQAKQVVCSAQLRQIAVGLRTYAGENDGAYPYGLAWPASPYGPHVFGADNPRGRFTDPSSYKTSRGYPAYIALYKYKQLLNPQVFYCPTQERLTYGGEYTWPKEPPDISEADEEAYIPFIIGYAWWADIWMSKDICFSKAEANFPQFMWGGYPDNWWAHGLGRSTGVGGCGKKRQVIADRADDPPYTMIASDIMSDYRVYSDILPAGTPINQDWQRHAPSDSYNSHGGPYRFVGGNVAYNDGSVAWRKRINCEADFKKSFFANDGPTADHPYFEHMAVIRADEFTELPGSFGVYNLYW